MPAGIDEPMLRYLARAILRENDDLAGVSIGHVGRAPDANAYEVFFVWGPLGIGLQYVKLSIENKAVEAITERAALVHFVITEIRGAVAEVARRVLPPRRSRWQRLMADDEGTFP